MQKLGVAVRRQRQEPDHHREAERRHVVEKPFDQPPVVDRLGHDQLRARVSLALEAQELALVVEGARFGAGREQERRLPFHGLAGRIETAVHVGRDLEQAHRVEVVDRGGEGIVAHLGRISGDDDQIANPGRVGGEQVRDQPEEVPVAAAHVEDRLDAGLALEDLAYGVVAHPGGGARPVGDVDHVDAAGLEATRRVDGLLGIGAGWGRELARHRELAAGELAGEGAALGDGHGGPSLGPRGALGLRDGNPSRERPGADHAHRAQHPAGVLGGGAAAATDEAHAGLQRAAGPYPEVLGVGDVDGAPLDDAGKPGVGLERDRRAGGEHRHPHLEQLRRSDTAVRADHVGPPAAQTAGHLVGGDSAARPPVGIEHHLGDDRQAAPDLPGGGDAGLDLSQVNERLEQDQIGAGVGQGPDLLLERRLDERLLLGRRVVVRDAGRADRARDVDVG